MVYIHGHKIQLCLISRRSRYRAGTRYFRRGIDHEGHVANFNETEQILLVEEQAAGLISNVENFTHKLSFVQVRGSVPVFWGEVNTLRYKPDLQIMDLQNTVCGCTQTLKWVADCPTRSIRCACTSRNRSRSTGNSTLSIWSTRRDTSSL